ncbi:hypothetical protein LCGC14_0945470 [marine sediment metagenome]|uniref:Uncharacterized protein n=1 Tax=marine sediment metagenome TaxID=412755 RepID=A0A0F9NIW5_9ZZZZ
MPTKKQLSRARKQTTNLRSQVAQLKKSQKGSSISLSSQEEKTILAEIKRLQEQKKGAGFLKKLMINKEINTRSQFFKRKRAILGLKQKGELIKLESVIAEQREKLQEAKRKSFITEEDIFGKKELFRV